MERISETEMAAKYKPFAIVNPKSIPAMMYMVADAIKNSQLLQEYNPDSQNQNFLQTAQMLWHFRKHGEYYQYAHARASRFFDILGMETPIVPSQELEMLNVCQQRMANPHVTFGDLRSMLSGWKEDDGNFIESQAFVYVPSLDTSVRPGILTDLTYAFRKKAATLPTIRDNAGQEVHRENWAASGNRNSRVVALLRAGIVLPYLEENNLGLNALFFAPALCTPENIRVYAEEVMGKDRPEGEIESRFKRELNFMKKHSIAPLENVVESAQQLVQEFAPERYKRFNKAVSS